MADSAVLGLILGQIIGRWGNFFNREAFGQVATSKNPFMMRIFFDDNYSINQVPDAVRIGMETLREWICQRLAIFRYSQHFFTNQCGT